MLQIYNDDVAKRVKVKNFLDLFLTGNLKNCLSIVLRYVTRLIFHPQHTEQDTWNDFEDIAHSLCHGQVRSLIAPYFLLWILAVCVL